MNKDQKRYLNYFKKWEGMGMLGICIAAIGFVCLWLGMSAATYIIAIVGMPLGLALFFYGSSGRAGESDLKNDIQRKTETLQFPELEINEGFRFRGRIPKDPEEQVFEGYVMREGLYLKKLKNGSLCSSEYTCAKMLILNDSFLIKTLTFSFLADTEQRESYEIAFTDVRDVRVERWHGTLQSATKKPFMVKTCHVCMTFGDGQELALPARDDIYTDEFVEKLKRYQLAGK